MENESYLISYWLGVLVHHSTRGICKFWYTVISHVFVLKKFQKCLCLNFFYKLNQIPSSWLKKFYFICWKLIISQLPKVPIFSINGERHVGLCWDHKLVYRSSKASSKKAEKNSFQEFLKGQFTASLIDSTELAGII